MLNNLSPNGAHFLFDIKGFPSSNQEDIKYLGFPYLKNGTYTQALNKIVMDFQAKIDHWKLKPLSQIGRLIMVKSVLLSLPIYVMQCNATNFPKS